MLAVTDGAGVDVAIECVGIPQTFTMCTELVRPGGHVANVGVHGTPVELALQDLWIQNITITTGLVNTTTLPMLLRLVAAGQAAGRGVRHPPVRTVGHRRRVRHLRTAAQTQALKVVLSR